MATRSPAARRRPGRPRGRSASRRPSRRRRSGDGVVLKLLVPIALLVVVALVGFILLRPTPQKAETQPTVPACPVVASVDVQGIQVPAGPIAGYCQTALVNAAQIVLAGKAVTNSEHAMEVGVMVAMGESSLQNLGYGDAAGPDSRGLFQQRSNYGSLASRMDPFTAASAFFHRMLGVPHWDTRPPTEVAHLVQGNANPDYYTPFFPRAVAVVEELLADRTPPPSFAVPVAPPPADLRP